MVIYSTDYDGSNSFNYIIVPKAEKGYKIPSFFSVRKVSRKFDKEGIFDVYSILGTSDYYVVGSIVSNKKEIDIVDSNEEVVKNIVIETGVEGTKSVLLFSFVESFTNEYYIRVNREKVLVSELDVITCEESMIMKKERKVAAILGGILGVVLVIVCVFKLMKKRINKEEKGEITTKSSLMEKGTAKNVSAEKFVVKMGFLFFWMGLIFTIHFLLNILEFREGEFVICWEVWRIVGLMVSILAMILPFPRMCEIVVDHGDISITTLLIFKKNFQFSDIVHCKKKFNGWEIYVTSQKKKAFFIYSIFDGSGLFMKRVVDMNIPIEK